MEKVQKYRNLFNEKVRKYVNLLNRNVLPSFSGLTARFGGHDPKENRLLLPENSRFRNIGEATCPTNLELQSSSFCIAVVISVAYNHMVEEVDAHKVASLFEGLGQSIVKLARMDVSARVVVDESQHGGIVQNGLLDNHPHVHAHLRQSTLAYPHLLDEFVVLAEQHNVSFLDGQVLHDG